VPSLSVAGYTPKHLADKILKSRSALEGERRQVTVLFGDVAGFTTLEFNSVDKRFDAVDDRFDWIEKPILADHKRRIERLEEQVKDLRDLLAVK
jgi:class 3 adenylate cyclase